MLVLRVSVLKSDEHLLTEQNPVESKQLCTLVQTRVRLLRPSFSDVTEIWTLSTLKSLAFARKIEKQVAT